MFLLIFLQVVCSKYCGIYQCSNSSFSSPLQCISKSGLTYNLGQCTAQYYSYCPSSQSPAFCQLRLSPSDINVAVPGQRCSFDRNCLDSLCNNGTCSGLGAGAACTTHAQCDVSLFCNASGLCSPQLAQGAACTSHLQCQNTLGCHFGACTPYFSLDGYALVKDCENRKNLLCSTGACYGNISANFCVSAVETQGMLPKGCVNDGDCLIGDGTMETYSTGCACGFNNQAQAYCNLAPGDSPVANATALLKAWQSNINASSCHTTVRNTLSCVQQFNPGLATNLTYFWYLSEMYAQVQGNDPCVQEIYTPSFWAAQQAYMAQFVTPTKSASVFLSLAIIIAVL
jgi:hypothetical protein